MNEETMEAQSPSGDMREKRYTITVGRKERGGYWARCEDGAHYSIGNSLTDPDEAAVQALREFLLFGNAL